MTDHIRDKIHRLLAKAEATPYEAEAMAFAAKAQALMTRYAIDVAQLDPEEARRVGTTELAIGDPYASARFSLLGAICAANRCQSVWSRRDGTCSIFGTDHDRAHVELLFTSLLLQATTAMAAHGSQHDAAGRNRTRAFRQSFLVGYAAEIARRLAEADEEVTVEATPGVQVVLASAHDEIEAEIRRRFPHVRAHRPSVSSGRGLGAGRDAGASADLGHSRVGARPAPPTLT